MMPSHSNISGISCMTIPRSWPSTSLSTRIKPPAAHSPSDMLHLDDFLLRFDAYRLIMLLGMFFLFLFLADRLPLCTLSAMKSEEQG